MIRQFSTLTRSGSNLGPQRLILYSFKNFFQYVFKILYIIYINYITVRIVKGLIQLFRMRFVIYTHLKQVFLSVICAIFLSSLHLSMSVHLHLKLFQHVCLLPQSSSEPLLLELKIHPTFGHKTYIVDVPISTISFNCDIINTYCYNS